MDELGLLRGIEGRLERWYEFHAFKPSRDDFIDGIIVGLDKALHIVREEINLLESEATENV